VTTLFDLMTQAQNGNAVDTMARQFQLNQDQMETAIAALMPAFSQGFKRNTADPTGLASWMEALAGGHHEHYFEDVTKALQPQGINEGNGILGHVFGSKDVSRAVASQAAQATGIGQEIFKQMLPVIASTLMGGMFKQMSGHTQIASAAQGNVFGQIFEQMKQNAGAARSPGLAERNANPTDNPFGHVLEQIFGTGGQVAPDEPDDTGRIPNPMNPDNNPWGKIFQDMMGGGAQSRQDAPEPQAAPDRQKMPYEDLFGDMFDAGRKSQEKFQDQYQRSMEQVFDQYMRGMDSFSKR
jgi:hypothetical protein